ncbi:PF04359 family protein [Bacteriovorax sp. BSW11_IV]|uniref:DUF493 family protein n=1 Tax=Bacteriovorax sp. BSW11_IV TaxID=1353529 RepID=UPI00038A1942|nr:DUF493 family protein [Bacteriovorax sp. BSW11_IV]EQC50322.1 PF04359 family protein [Bacteriovorax sp. BSW11_IV]
MASTEKLKELLDNEYDWPSYYLFKFVVHSDHVDTFKVIVEHDNFMERPSKNGKYVSLTFKKLMNSSEEVLLIYEKVSTVPGIISL